MLEYLSVSTAWRRAARVVLFALAPAAVAAQEATRITGRITNDAGQPIPAVRVAIPELGLGTLSSDDGRYTLAALARAVGQTVTLTTRRVGLRPASRSVTLRSGTITEDFVVEQTTLTLDRVVVTGSPGATRERELGNTVSTIDVATPRTAPAPSRPTRRVAAGITSCAI